MVPEGEQDDWTPLHRAAHAGEVEDVRRLLSEGLGVNALDMYRRPPLRLATIRALELRDELAQLHQAQSEREGEETQAADPGPVDVLHADAEALLEWAEAEQRKAEEWLRAQREATPHAILDPGPYGPSACVRPLARYAQVIRLLRSAGGVDAVPSVSGYGRPNRRPTMRLHDAARLGVVAELRAHLYWGCDVDARHRSGLTPLHLALAGGHDEAARLLIEAGADVLARSSVAPHALPIHAAAWHSGTAAVRLLLDRGADAAARDAAGETAVHAAAAGGNEPVLDLLLKTGAVDVAARDGRGRTALYPAAAGGHVSALRLLMAAGADVHVRDAEGRTPLWAAAEHERSAALRLLIDGGCDVKATDQQGSTVLCGVNSWDLDAELVRCLLAAGADPDERRAWNGGTVLHRAATSGNVPAAEALLTYGAAVDLPDRDGNTPLHAAAERAYGAGGTGQGEVARLLVAEGADVNARNRTGLTPLRSAVRNGNMELAELLLRAGADPNHDRVLHLAASRGLLPMVRLLLKYGAKTDGGGGRSAVEVAAPPVREYLLAKA